ncbi:MAG TPA: biotin/lipoyl-binding protein, partial [Archangium sp.]|nr:biotin/lipoyl-binding protein [Archangium sp.]
MSTGRRGVAWAVLVLLSLGALPGCNRGNSQAQQPQEQASMVLGPEDVVRVDAQELRSGPVLSGTLQARRAATMRAEVQGAVLEMVVEQGQQVKKGQLLARIEDTSLQDQLIA